jgi:hypothetical protein
VWSQRILWGVDHFRLQVHPRQTTTQTLRDESMATFVVAAAWAVGVVGAGQDTAEGGSGRGIQIADWLANRPPPGADSASAEERLQLGASLTSVIDCWLDSNEGVGVRVRVRVHGNVHVRVARACTCVHKCVTATLAKPKRCVCILLCTQRECVAACSYLCGAGLPVTPARLHRWVAQDCQ